MRCVVATGLTILALLITTADLRAQRNPVFYNYPYHHLEWYTIESDHFLVHFQEGNSRPAQVISRIAEEIYIPITELYNHEPDHKISILLTDRLDYSNGAAFFYDNKIEIWLPSLDTPLRGTHDWLRNVITHEFTHIIQLQAAMKNSRRHPATYLQWLSYEEVRRPDVLYGFPNTIISYPLSGITMPAWLAEGTAQFMRANIFYDDWDSHRDMLLRTRILDGTYLGLEKMGTFYSKTALERELVYNQGFDFTRYIAERLGEQALADITRIFSQRGTHDVDKAIEQATGIPGTVLFDDWIADRKARYDIFMEGRDSQPDNRTWVETKGFFNMHPVFHPDGKQLAYLSNKETYSAVAKLILRDIEDTGYAIESTAFENLIYEQAGHKGSNMSAHRSHASGGNPQHRTGGQHMFSCHLNQTLLRRLETSFSFSPDGSSIAYSRTSLNRYGEQYRDLHLYDLETGKSRRLTRSQRLQDPAWSPDGETIVAGKIEDGSTNLFLYHVEKDSLIRLTDFRSGEQVYRPVWHPSGQSIYFAYSSTGNRNIRRIEIELPASGLFRASGEDSAGRTYPAEPVLANESVDFRDPVLSPDGRYLYFSADISGAFNVYRLDFTDKQIYRITNVAGGAFMPSPHPENELLLYSEYRSDGYKIALLDLTEMIFDVVTSSFHASDAGNAQRYPAHDSSWNLNDYDDTDIKPLKSAVKENSAHTPYTFQLPTRGSSSERQLYRYEDQFTSFQFYPVFRLDTYSRMRGSNTTLLRSGEYGDFGANMWRDFKTGAYFASREMRERFSIFGGALFGPGSRSSDGVSNFFAPGRLVSLDRDLFLEVEYAGLPFIKRHWSPTVSLAFFNIRRNVQDGLQIEEFPCTACLPDTTATDIAYNMWQLEVSLISKLNRWSLLELGYHYSPYRVSTESFYSREYRQEIPGSTSRYYSGSTWTTAWIFNLTYPEPHRDIAPLGWRGIIRYRYEPSELLDSYDIRDGTLIPIYDQFHNHSMEAELRYGFLLASQRIQMRTRVFSYLDGPDEFFYLDYIGGLIGMRSYPFYALGGTRTAFSQLSWLIPLKTDIYHQMGRFTLDKVFLRLFAEAGNGWGGPLDIDSSIKTGAGAELRIGMNSYYFFPTSLFFSTAYGFNAYDLQLPDAFITETPTGRVSYGNQLLLNFGILFDFEF